jgi:mono/diheme cytochrome c family protein
MKNRPVMTKFNLRPWLFLFAGLLLAFQFNSCGNNAATEGEDDAVTEEAAPPAEEVMDPVAQGREWYLSYCTMCHGEEGKGDGVLADSLSMSPPDLTTIARRRGGNFPVDEITNIIGDAAEVPGHSTGDMPAWWETFQASEGIADAEELQTRIENITAYLKTIQVE